MTCREAKWLDAAIMILSDSPNYWMTAPEMVREIQRRDIRTLNNYGQAVRTLRAALNVHSKKPQSLFVRSEGDFNVCFALRERLNSIPDPPKPTPTQCQKRKKVSPKDPRQPQQHLLVNGLPQTVHQKNSPHAPAPIAPGPRSPVTDTSKSTAQSPPPSAPAALNLGRPLPTLTVEIDPAVKSSRALRPSFSESDVGSCLCLPSPLCSILGPRRTLQVLNESTISSGLRPVRQVRKRKSSTKEGGEEAPLSPPLLNGCSFELPPAPKVLQVEAYHPLPSYLSDVVCISSSYDSSSLCSTSSKGGGEIKFEDPCCAQGGRSHSAVFELEPKYPRKPKARTEGGVAGAEPLQGAASVSSSESDSEISDHQFHQPCPSSRLLMSRRLSQQRQAASINYSQLESMMSSQEEEEDDDDDDVDVEYVGPAGYPRGASRGVSGASRKQRKGPVLGSRGSMEEGGGGGGGVRRMVEQKRNIGSLFQPQSPLVSENMKSILNMSAFTALSEAQKAHLVKLLPAVDRVGPSAIRSDSLSNSFYSSALREWVEQVAMGAFTAEYRAKVRAEEKKRTTARAENTWKARFFEESWGRLGRRRDEDEVPKQPPSPTPFYPHNTLSPKSKDCLQRILKAYSGKDTKELLSSSQPSAGAAMPPPPPVPSTQLFATPPPDHAPTTPPTGHQLGGASGSPNRTQQKRSPRPSPSKTVTSPPKKVVAVTKMVQVQKKNHVAKKTLAVPVTVGKGGKTSAKKSTSSVIMVPKNSMRVDKLKIIKQLRMNSQHSGNGSSTKVPTQFLTRLPPRTPYQSLLLTLAQASKANAGVPPYAPPTSSSSSAPEPHEPLSTAATHTHPVFHDHFALLSHQHVPLEFSPPVTSLSLQLPLDAYTSCMCARMARREHSYARSPTESPPSQPAGGKDTQPAITTATTTTTTTTTTENLDLKLSLPRSLLQTDDVCSCDRGALVICSQCRSLYHSRCGQSTLCSTCVTLQSLNLS